jgi:Cu/Ag efflux protein CusF
MNKHRAPRLSGRVALSAGALFAVSLLAAASLPAAQEFSRGKIVSVDWGSYTMQLQDPKGRVATWKVARDATVKFSDGAAVYSHPKLQDLRPPMYIHFMFQDEVIQTIDVRELGFTPGRETAPAKQAGIPRTITAKVTAYDVGKGHIEVEHDGMRETFAVANKALLNGVAGGQTVTLVTDWAGQTELVAQLKIVGSPASPGAATTATGRIVRIGSRGVVISSEGREETYGVASSKLLSDLHPGDRVHFTYEQRGATKVITAIE